VGTAQAAVEQVAVRLGVYELIVACCDCIDDDRLEKWRDHC
jgi:hypothetical protein